MFLTDVIKDFNNCNSRSEIFKKFECHQKGNYFYFDILEYRIKFNNKNEIISIYNSLENRYLHIV